MKNAQSLIDRGRVFDDEGVLAKNQLVSGDVYLVKFKPEPKGLKPIFEDENFAVYDKPSGVLTHPNGRDCIYSMSDEIVAKFGKSAKVAHRLDKETSGVLLVAKDIAIEKEIKTKFEKGEISKLYLAMAEGIIDRNFSVNEALALKNGAKILKNKIYVDESGKRSKTNFEVVENYDNFNATLLRCIPLTGRQHQIRVHMFHVKHKILGDPLYGVSDEFACRFLDGKVDINERLIQSGASRLMLHSQNLTFKFRGKNYNINSEFKAKNEFEIELKNSISYRHH